VQTTVEGTKKDVQRLAVLVEGDKSWGSEGLIVILNGHSDRLEKTHQDMLAINVKFDELSRSIEVDRKLIISKLEGVKIGMIVASSLGGAGLVTLVTQVLKAIGVL
jgi:hypothetical protein